jgi:hypothetical protein
MLLGRLRRARIVAGEDAHNPGQLDAHPLCVNTSASNCKINGRSLEGSQSAALPSLSSAGAGVARERQGNGAAVLGRHLRLQRRLISRRAARSVPAANPAGRCLLCSEGLGARGALPGGLRGPLCLACLTGVLQLTLLRDEFVQTLLAISDWAASDCDKGGRMPRRLAPALGGFATTLLLPGALPIE